MNLIERLRNFDRFYERVHREIAGRVIAPRPDSKALDVGCGAGGMTALLAAVIERGCVVALDPNPACLQATRERIEEAGALNRVLTLIGDVEKLQLLGGEFDFIWCSRVIHHHLPDPQPALSEMYRVLRPHGHLFLRENSNADFAVSIPALRLDLEFSERLRMANTRWFQSKFKSRRPTAEDWLRRMEQAGLNDVHVETLAFESPNARDALAYIQSWLHGLLEDHQSPEHGNLLSATDADRIRRTMKEIGQHLEQPDDRLQAMEIQIESTTPVFIGTK
jgi:ubiquinone/menaquinone biosynthesis C-methylase UbiE